MQHRGTTRARLRLEDFRDLEVLSDPDARPRHEQVTVVATRADPRRDAWTSALHLVDLRDGARRPLTAGPADHFPRWSPDGRWLAHLRGAGAECRAVVLPEGGGPARPVGPAGVVELAWTPASDRLALVVVGPAHQAEQDPVVVERPGWKADGEGVLRPRTWSVVLVDTAGGGQRRLTTCTGPVRDLRWSPDGRSLALVAALAGDPPGTAQLCTLPSAGGPLRPVTRWGLAAAAPDWSPDGDLLVLAARDLLRSGPTRLFAVPPDGGTPRPLLPSLDRNVMVGTPVLPGARPRVLPDGQVALCVRERGAVHLVTAPLGGGAPRTLVGGDVVVSGLTVGPLSCLVADAGSTPDVHLVEDGGTRRVTRSNQRFFSSCELPPVQSRTFGGGAVHGYLTGAAQDGPRPLLLDVHGGPHDAWGPAFRPAHAYQQVLAAAGWLVLAVNPRGSDGYGEAFWRSTHRAWGTGDVEDLLGAVDELVAAGLADPRRLAVTGHSYGGYLTCLLTTRTDRFAAAVAGSCLVDLAGFCGTTDVAGTFDVAEFGAPGVEVAELLRELSPLRHVRAVRTPTLLLHGQADERCPVGQAEQWFTALHALGRPVQLVLYPGAGHFVALHGRPSQREDWSRRTVAWVQDHAPPADPAVPDAG